MSGVYEMILMSLLPTMKEKVCQAKSTSKNVKVLVCYQWYFIIKLIDVKEEIYMVLALRGFQWVGSIVFYF